MAQPRVTDASWMSSRISARMRRRRKPVQQCERAFHDPAVDAQAGAVFASASGDVRGDLEPADLIWVDVMVVAAIRVQMLRAPQWLPALAADRRDSLDQRDELGDIVAVAAGGDR